MYSGNTLLKCIFLAIKIIYYSIIIFSALARYPQVPCVSTHAPMKSLLSTLFPISPWGTLLTWRIERHGSAGMSGKVGAIMRVEGAAVAELELGVRRKVREAGSIVQAAGREVHGEAAHLAGAAEEGRTAHAGDLLHASLLWSLVLEPHLENTEDKGVRFQPQTQRYKIQHKCLISNNKLSR